MDEIKDAVPACIHAGDQVRPGHRTLRRNAGGEQAERSLLRQGGKIRHPALGHELFQQLRIHAVDAENDDLLIALPFSGLAGNQQRSRRAHQQGQNKFPDRSKRKVASIIVDIK